MNFCKSLCVSLFLFAFLFSFPGMNFAQERQRVIPPNPSRTNSEIQRPTLTDRLIIRQQQQQQQQNQLLVKNTVSSKPTSVANSIMSNSANVASLAAVRQKMMGSIESKLGLRYVYGSTGPNTYDCSGFVWSVFNDAGVDFSRSSARNYWSEFEPVFGDDRYKFGTLVFFNRLGHVGIVVDDKGFYHASTSKGITYSKFAGYWEKRIVGYRRIPVEYLTAE